LHPGASALLDIGLLEALGKVAGGFVQGAQTSGLRGIGLVNEAIAKRSEILYRLMTGLSENAPLPNLGPAVDSMAAVRSVSHKLADFRRWLIDDLVEAGKTQIDADRRFFARKLTDNLEHTSDEQKKSFIELALFYDLSADLIDKVPLKPLVIAPARDDLLSGAPLYGFAGFFDQALRDRDYKQGEFDAYNAWSQVSREHGEFDLTGTPTARSAAERYFAPGEPPNLRERTCEVQDRVQVVLD
jgi:hypothetical protein